MSGPMKQEPSGSLRNAVSGTSALQGREDVRCLPCHALPLHAPPRRTAPALRCRAAPRQAVPNLPSLAMPFRARPIQSPPIQSAPALPFHSLPCPSVPRLPRGRPEFSLDAPTCGAYECDTTAADMQGGFDETK